MLIENKGKNIKLPDFFIVGAAKSGTTSLAKYLAEHPNIFLPTIKEPQFFAVINNKHTDIKPKGFFIDNLDNYISLFSQSKETQIIGEASTWYSVPIAIDNTISNIIELYKNKTKDLKFIFIIRNPIERLLSSYNMYVELGFENLPFEEAIFKGQTRINNSDRPELNYIENTFISDSVEKYITTFGEKNVRIYLYEELKHTPLNLIKDAFSFLEVTSEFIPKNLGIAYNTSGLPKSHFHKTIYNITIKNNPLKGILKTLLSTNPKFKQKIKRKIEKKFFRKTQISLEIENKLKKIFKEDIEKLEKIIDKNLSHWIKL